MAELSRRAFLALAAAVPLPRSFNRSPKKPDPASFGAGSFGSGPFGS